MKRFALIVVLSGGLIAGPAMADHGGNVLNRENIGGAIGAALGGLAGNKIVEGDGQAAATAAGAVGGFLLGKNIAHNYRGGGYAESGGPVGYRRTSGYQRTRSYQRTRGYKHKGGYQRDHRYRNDACCGDDGGYAHRIQPIHETFVAKCTSNVRAGPSTRYHVIDQLYDRERVKVIGKVRGRNWYLVSVGHRRGYVYAPLLRRDHYGYGNY